MEDVEVKCVIVDDEKEGLDMLEYLLSEIDSVDVLAKISNPEEVIGSILDKKPGIVFLDINMPNKSGIDILKEINNLGLKVKVVFTTAFDNYVFDAMKNSAFDYLVKPIDRDELKETIDRYRMNSFSYEEPCEISKIIENLENISKIRIPVNYGSLFYNPQDIVSIDADGAYTIIMDIKGNKEMSTISLGKLEEKLRNNGFFRISRSTVVNLFYVTKIDRRCKKCTLEVNNMSYDYKVSRNNMNMLNEYFG